MAIIYETPFPFRNNLAWLGSPAPGIGAASVEELDRDFMHFEFGIKWTGANGALSLPVSDSVKPAIGLSQISIESEAFFADVHCPLWMQWVLGTQTGTIKEQFFNFATLLVERDNVDPGFGDAYIGGATQDAGRMGPQYLFALNGGKYEAYVDFRPNTGQIPIAVAQAPGSGVLLPLRLEMFTTTNVVIRDVQIGGEQVRASYSAEAQIKHFGSIQANYYLRFYQKSPFYPGVPHGAAVDVIAPPL